MQTAATDLDERYKDAISSLAKATAESTGNRLKSKRKRLMVELKEIKATAENVSASFGVASSIAGKIEKRIEVEQAMALIG